MANSITNAFEVPRSCSSLLLAGRGSRAREEVPEWFAETMLDARDEAADAAKQGKRLMLYFWLEGCPYCQRMTSVTFRDAAVLERLKRSFVPVGGMFAATATSRGPTERRLRRRRLAAKLAVRGTPTIVFLDARGSRAASGGLCRAAPLRLLKSSALPHGSPSAPAAIVLRWWAALSGPSQPWVTR